MGVYRTRASLCLGALITCAIAARNRSRILDDVNRLRQGRLADPAAIEAIFAQHGRAASFEAFADAFCDAIGFAASWPGAQAALADLDRSSR